MNMVHFFDAVSEVRITSAEQRPVDGDVVIAAYEEE
jgi:hypothetical protein